MTYVGKKPADIIATAVDTTTGTFSGDLTVDTNTLYVDSANNRVGVGTATPVSRLTIKTSGNGLVDGFIIEDADSTTRSAITHVNGDFYISSDASTDHFIIDSSGNVGIGTSSPSSYYSTELVVATSDNGGITLANSNTTHSSYIMFADGTTGSQQYAGQFGYDHNIDAMVFHTNVSERMRIDSSGRVMIGTTTEGEANGDDLTIATTGATGITIRSGTSSDGHLFFSDGTSGADEYRGYLQYNHQHNRLAFGTDATERMRIDSSGNLLVGTTLTPAQLVDGASGEGLGYQAGDFLGICRDNGGVMHLNRLSTDGEMISFRKDGTTVGSIGSNTGYLYIGSTVLTDAFIGLGNSYIYPSDSIGGYRDNAIDLGYSTSRFKDLYLSGGVYLGGTGSANYLDDYEEGTHTITFTNSGASPIGAGSVYTKIGSVVNYVGSFTFPSSSDSTDINISIPFTSASNNSIGQIFTNGVTNKVLFTGGSGTNYMRIYPDNSFSQNSYADLSGVAIYFTITYRTT